MKVSLKEQFRPTRMSPEKISSDKVIGWEIKLCQLLQILNVSFKSLTGLARVMTNQNGIYLFFRGKVNFDKAVLIR